jgi:putative FmdB family regulatory protein
VAIYEYRCGDCGIFERSMPMGTAPDEVACSMCGHDAKRVFSVPMNYRLAKPVATMLAREEASRDYPEVVDRVPSRRTPSRPTAHNPVLARLPKS